MWLKVWKLIFINYIMDKHIYLNILKQNFKKNINKLKIKNIYYID